MLATRWPAAFDDEGWWFEVKWDGYRALVYSEGGRVDVRSRRGLDLLGPFPELANLDLPSSVVLDGEVVAFDEEGRPSFSLLQRRTGFGGGATGARVAVSLVVFDLLYRDAELLELSYEERRSRLEALELEPPVLVPEATPARGLALFETARDHGLEGIVAKRGGSTYQPGRRSPDWRKTSVRRRLRAVVGGYLPGQGGRARTFGSLLLGLYTPEGLRYIGAVGSGFDDEALKAFSEALAQLRTETSPFVDEVPGEPVWVEPGIVVVAEFKDWTPDGRLRAPVFKGVEIADPETVTWDEEGPG